MQTVFLPPLWPPTFVWIAFVAGIAVALIASLLCSGRWISKATRNILRGIAAAVILAAAMGFIIATNQTLGDFYVPALFNSPFAALAALVLGYWLYRLRAKYLHLYAALELVGAVATITICAITPYGSSYARAAALLTAIYFLVRGMDNAEKGKLFRRLRVCKRKVGSRNLVIWAVLMSFGLALGVWSDSQDRDVAAPYRSKEGGGRTPVSALECGGFFIVCDEAAWRERDRLMNGTPADRARAEQDVARRLRDHQERSN